MFIRKNCGLTLIELLIAMLLSSLILLMAYSLLHYQQHLYEQHKQNIHLEQNKRAIQFILSNAIHNAGFLGCRSLANTKIKNNLSGNHSFLDTTHLFAVFAYQSFANTWRPSLPKGINAKKGTDVLAIIYMSPHSFALNFPMQSPTDSITINETSTFKKNDIIAIGDCDQADIFTISHVNGFKKQLEHAPPKNSSVELSKAYAQPSEVGQLLYYFFYIHDDALYMLDQSDIPEKLIDHVRGFKLSFATQSTSHDYLAAHFISNWSHVHSVKIDVELFNEDQANENYSFITSLRNQ